MKTEEEQNSFRFTAIQMYIEFVKQGHWSKAAMLSEVALLLEDQKRITAKVPLKEVARVFPGVAETATLKHQEEGKPS